MANYRAIANGNWSAGATWAGGAVPPNGEGHNVYSNNFTVTIDQNVNVAFITNAAITASFVGGGTSATMGGYFELANGVTLTGNIVRGNSSAGNAYTLLLSGTNSANVVGNILSQAGLGSGGGTANCFLINSSGTINITGNVTGGDNAQAAGIYTTSSATINIIGNVTAGNGGNSSNAFSRGIQSTGLASINVTGSVSGGGPTTTAQIGLQHGNGNLSIVGTITAGSTVGSFGVSTGSGTILIVGDIFASNSANGVSAIGNSNTVFSGSFISSSNGTTAIYCPQYRVSPSPLNARTRYAANGSGTYVDMFTADNALGQASPTDVRSGVSYASGNLTGRLTVPARGSVSLSVNYGPSMPFTATRSGTTATATLAYSYPLVVGDQITVTGASNSEWNSTYTIASVVSGTSVTFTIPNTHSATAGTGATMQTTGTAVLDPAAVATAVWGAATRTITGGVVDTLTNAPSVPSAATIASQVRTELGTELGRIDATISSRLAASAYTAPSAAPTAAQNATAVRAELGTELGRIDATISSRLSPSGTLATVTTLTNAPTVPTAAAIASQVRTELATELARVDVATSTRLAGSAYTAPASAPTAAQNASAVRTELAAELARVDAAVSTRATQANIDAIKAKTDLLNTDRLAQVSTVSTTGAQLAAALS
jgi:hypothetical protein